ncbi:MAG: hypothetical protein ACRD2W_22755 [Acidimicrobiales bacterium]
MKRLTTAALLAAALTISTAGIASAGDGATCSDLFGYPHGYHIVADYVTGEGSEFLGGPGISWPPTGVNAAGGAAIPGGPGPGFHSIHGVAPGASFCTDSKSPGAHL